MSLNLKMMQIKSGLHLASDRMKYYIWIQRIPLKSGMCYSVQLSYIWQIQFTQLNMKFSILDTVVFIFYGILIITVGIIISYSSAKKQNSKSYFFANKSLPWYIVGTSIIAANISAEQFIGMSGSGYAMGLTIATYEWIAAPILLLVAWLFLPIFISKQINTMPQFLEIRYNKDIKTVLAVFWIVLFVFVNLTSILYLGALSLKTIFGIKLIYGILGLAIFSAIYTLGGGL